jgi:phosphoglycerate kinase
MSTGQKLFIEDLDPRGKRVIVRVDFNVPLKDGVVESDKRLRESLPTIKYLKDKGAKVILMSHLGRPDGKNVPEMSLAPVAKALSGLLGSEVKFASDSIGDPAKQAAAALQPGDVLLLENLRFHAGEKSKDAAFAAELASLADVYVNDAFGTCHRSDASMVAVPAAFKGKPRVVGNLVAKELQILDKLLSDPPRPMVGILGGAKVSDKVGFIRALLGRVDKVLIGGAMTYLFMKAQGRGIGNSFCETKAKEGQKTPLQMAQEILERGKGKIVLPIDHLVVADVKSPQTARVVEGDIPAGAAGVDIGPKTIALYQEEIGKAGTVVWNGPMGKFEDEPYSKGTKAIAEALANAKATTVVGGGETAEAVEEFGLADKMTHVSTGGGAFLEYVEGTPFKALGEIDER